jgi:hypothetical protein
MLPYYITNYMKKRAALNVADPEDMANMVESTTVGGPVVEGDQKGYVEPTPEKLEQNNNHHDVSQFADQMSIEGVLRVYASPSMNNLPAINNGIDTEVPPESTDFLWNNKSYQNSNQSDGLERMGSSDKEKEADVESPHSSMIDTFQGKGEDIKKNTYNITSFARIGKGEDPYVDGVIYGYDQLLKQHQTDVDVNWAKETSHKGRGFLWLRTSMKTADLINESEKWYRKNRNKKWALEDRDRVLHLASLMMDGAIITPLMVSPIGESKGGCWEGYHRMAAADMLQIKRVPVIVKIDPDDFGWQEKVAQHERQPWAAVDLDGTILVEDDAEHEGRPPLGEPYPGAKEALQELVDAGVRVSIWTARQYFEEEDGDNAEWQKEIDDHLKYHQIPYTDIYVGKKPPADVFIDNKAVAFKENWPQALQEAVQHLKEGQLSMGAAIEEEAVMIGDDNNKKDQYTTQDDALNMPSTWPGQSIAE